MGYFIDLRTPLVSNRLWTPSDECIMTKKFKTGRFETLKTFGSRKKAHSFFTEGEITSFSDQLYRRRAEVLAEVKF